MPRPPVLPEGVVIRELTVVEDSRGSLVELDRASWHERRHLQWTSVNSIAGVLRGAHLHKRHTDHLVVTDGELVVGLADFRRDPAETICDSTSARSS